MDSVRFDPENALTRDGGGRAEVAKPPQTDDPEPIGPLAEQFLDQLAAQDADLADRRRNVLRRLGRANTTNPLVRRQH
ncbi:hypothetical protein GAR05_06128 [Micromonospora saelicesensis]|uniref:Uncharacterized protein n=1 Tax=Micromonospora saelicesensis TaxID=285676 RepID=A0ABX9CAB6_9ACTN|nr:hypothetical protein [Micromonospora saelicesensis]RAN92636.1 hypothetical protein GAR05_06128 [Micromonospora saelicesensis]